MGRLAANVLAQGSFLESRFEGPGDSRGVLPVSSTWRVFLGSIFRLEIKTPCPRIIMRPETAMYFNPFH